LLGLSADVAGDELAGRWIKRDLAAEKEQISSTHSGGKGSYRRRDPVGRDYLSTHVMISFQGRIVGVAGRCRG